MRSDDYAARQREQQRQAASARAAESARQQQADRAREASNREAARRQKQNYERGLRESETRRIKQQTKLEQQDKDHKKYLNKMRDQASRNNPLSHSVSKQPSSSSTYDPATTLSAPYGTTTNIPKTRNGGGGITAKDFEKLLLWTIALNLAGFSTYMAYKLAGGDGNDNSVYWAMGTFIGVLFITYKIFEGPLHFLIVSIRLIITWTLYAIGTGCLLYFGYQAFLAFHNTPSGSP